MSNVSINTDSALHYFKTTDPIMYRLLYHSLSHEKPVLVPQPKKPAEYFGSLINSIISQQISTAAARSIQTRVHELLGELTPEMVIQTDFYTLKAYGLSEKKTQYIKQNAELWHEIPVQKFIHLSNQEIITELIKLYGIGRWTAEMFLIFSLARPDVFSYGDLGLMKSLYRHYNYKPHYVRKVQATVDSWSPHRTLASLTLWHTIDTDPVLL